MVIIVDKNTNKVLNTLGKLDLYPDGNIPNLELKENEKAIKIHDDSELVEKISNAVDYELVLEEGHLIDVKINKTLEQYKQEQEQSPAFLMQKIKSELSELDLIVPRILEDIISQGNFEIHQSKLDIIARKQELRAQLNSLEV